MHEKLLIYFKACFSSIVIYVLFLSRYMFYYYALLLAALSSSDSRIPFLLAPCFPLTLDRPSPWRSPTMSHTILSSNSLCSLLALLFLLEYLVSIKWKWQRIVLVTIFLLPNVDEQWQRLTVLTILSLSLSSSVSFQCATPLFSCLGELRFKSKVKARFTFPLQPTYCSFPLLLPASLFPFLTPVNYLLVKWWHHHLILFSCLPVSSVVDWWLYDRAAFDMLCCFPAVLLLWVRRDACAPFFSALRPNFAL